MGQTSQKSERNSSIKAQNWGFPPKKKKERKKSKSAEGMKIVQRMKGMKLCTGIKNASFKISQDDKRHTGKCIEHSRMMRFLLVCAIYPRRNDIVTRLSFHNSKTQKQKVVKIIASSDMIQ